MTETVTKRFYIGGLASDVSADEITERFSRFGKVRNVSLKSRTDDEGNHIKSFAHLDMETDEAKMKKCFDTYQNTKWKGSVLKLQYAKESFLERLAKEREENDIETPPENPSPAKAPDKSDIKGPAVPGTPVPGKPDWVVAKYGRVLPVLKLKKSYKIKGVKHDPSKHCHAAKVFKDESDPVTDPSCNKLTWELNTPDSEITKKRKGEFPEDSSPVKRNKSSAPMSKTSQAASSSFNLTQSSFNSVSGQRKNLYKKEEDELEIVKIGQGHKTICKPLNNSNKFDSDIESDVEAKIIEAEPKKNKAVKKKNNNQVLKKNVVIAIKDGGEKQAPVTDLNTGTVEREVNSKNSSVKKAETNNNVLSPKTLVNDKINDFKCQSPQDETKIPEVSGFKILNPDTAAVKSPFLKEIPHKISAHLSSQKLPVGNNKNKFSEDDDPPRLIPEFRGLSMLPDFPSLQTADLKKSQEVTYSVLSDAVEKKISKPEGSHILTNNNSSKSVGKEKHSTDTEGEGDYDSASSADTDEIIARYKRTSQISGNVTPSSGAQSDAPSKPVNFSLLSKSPVTPKGIKNSFIGEDSYYLSEYSPGPLSDYSLPNSTPGVKTDESSYDSDLDSNDFELVVKKLSQKAKAVAPEIRSKPVKAEIREIEEVIESHESKSPHKNLSGPKQNNSALLHKKEKPQSSAEDVEKSKHQDIFSDKVKHAADNEKRLLAIREKLKLKDQQTSIMQKALQKVDSKENSGNRIVFSSDSESGASSDSDKDGIEELNIKSKIKKKQKLTLFENSSDDDSDSEAMFESKPHFEGKKGEKLMKLERKIGDSRFKLDAKFAESDSDEGSEKEKEEIDEAMDIDEGLQKEKAASLKVLENVIGKSTLDRFSEKIKRNTKHLIDMNAVRFDPTKILTQKEAPINDDKKKKKEMVSPLISLQVNDVSSNKKEEKIKKRHEEVKTSEQKEMNGLIKKGQPIDLESKKLKEKEKEQVIKKSADSKIVESPRKSRVKLATSLVNLFKSKNEATQEKDNTKTFSLLEQFDKDDNMELRKEENDSSSEVKDDDKAPLSGLFKSSKQRDTRLEISKEKAVLLQKQLLEDSNDDDLSEQDQGEDSENDTSTIQIPSLENKTEKQLIEAGRIDIRFSKELWLQRWEELRPTIVKLYKRKHKEALKSKRVDNEMKRKKEFLKNAKKGHWNRKR